MPLAQSGRLCFSLRVNMGPLEIMPTEGVVISPDARPGQAGVGAPDSRRFFALDGLRASMMLLGFYLIREEDCLLTIQLRGGGLCVLGLS